MYTKEGTIDVKLRKLSTQMEIYKALMDISNIQNPPLTEKIPDLNSYASKLFNNAEVYVCETVEVLGFIAFYANDKDSKIAYITQIAVRPHAQNMHLGKRLLELCFQVSVTLGMRWVKLEVNKKNRIAICFYEKNGFKFCNQASEQTMYMEKKL